MTCLVTRPLEPGAPLDPVAVAGDDGILIAGPDRSLVGLGRLRTLPLSGGLADQASRQWVAEQLGGIEEEDHVGVPGTGVVACGALPFRPDAPGHLVVPRICYGADAEGREWITVPRDLPRPPQGWRHHLISRGQATALAVTVPPVAAVTSVTPVPSPASYASRVARAVACIDRGRLDKVVLARALDLELDTSPRPVEVARRLRSGEPTCWTFSVPVPGGHFLGASPELLVCRDGATVRSHPLAGTASLEDQRRLQESAKEHQEHRLAVAQIAAHLRPYCTVLHVPPAPELVRLGSLFHLGTPIQGVLDPEHPAGILDLLAILHPTPAVGGEPRREAMDLIGALEGQPRGTWAGPVGWVDSHGNGVFVVGIRSMTVYGARARLWAGAGIVHGSDPEQELAETTLKLEPVLAALHGSLVVDPPAPEGSTA